MILYATFFTQCIIFIKLISPIIKFVDETNNITYDNIFIIMLPLFSCHSCFDIPLLPFIQSFESGFTVIYNDVYMLVRELQREGSPPQCLHLPSIKGILPKIMAV